jgi:hypothetical protein
MANAANNPAVGHVRARLAAPMNKALPRINAEGATFHARGVVGDQSTLTSNAGTRQALAAANVKAYATVVATVRTGNLFFNLVMMFSAVQLYSVNGLSDFNLA